MAHDVLPPMRCNLSEPRKATRAVVGPPVQHPSDKGPVVDCASSIPRTCRPQTDPHDGRRQQRLRRRGDGHRATGRMSFGHSRRGGLRGGVEDAKREVGAIKMSAGAEPRHPQRSLAQVQKKSAACEAAAKQFRRRHHVASADGTKRTAVSQDGAAPHGGKRRQRRERPAGPHPKLRQRVRPQGGATSDATMSTEVAERVERAEPSGSGGALS